MREIKFRGMNTSGYFVYGSLVNNCVGLRGKAKQNTKTWIVTSAFGNGGWFNIRGRSYVKPETVDQYTGLIDVNGAEIYEGDIMAGYSPVFGEVCGAVSISEYEDCECYQHKAHTGWNVNEIPIKDLVCDGLTVIGNVHQNHELLK